MTRIAYGCIGTAAISAFMPYGPAPSLMFLILSMGLVIGDGLRRTR